jgi:hypothetical protein
MTGAKSIADDIGGEDIADSGIPEEQMIPDTPPVEDTSAADGGRGTDEVGSGG